MVQMLNIPIFVITLRLGHLSVLNFHQSPTFIDLYTLQFAHCVMVPYEAATILLFRVIG
jgi:hypothetical protein